MISPGSVIQLLKEKNRVAERHPKFVGFVGETLREGLEPEDKLVLSVVHKDGTVSECDMEITADDKRIFSALGAIFK